MTTDEKLQQAAENYVSSRVLFSRGQTMEDWLEGAKSSESLEYWKEKEKLYTEEEVKRLITLATREGVFRGNNALDYCNRWFELNKK